MSHTGSQPNQCLTLSAAGQNELTRREGVVRHYYNDAANNCTYGVGTLAHLGSCTADELHTQLTDQQMATSLHHGVHIAENAVRRNVTHHRLTQRQFDALVSFTYNVGTGGARNVLRLVDQGHLEDAAHLMKQYTNATVYGADGQPERDKNGDIITRVLPGLVSRRRDESAPFESHENNRGYK